MLVFSVYIPPIDMHHIYDMLSMQTTLDEIEATIRIHSDTSFQPTTLLCRYYRSTLPILIGLFLTFSKHLPSNRSE
jgi:hypothetical protein